MESSHGRDVRGRGSSAQFRRAVLAPAAVFALFALPLSLAHAQDRWLFLPVVIGGGDRALKSFDPAPLTGELEIELRGASQNVLPNASAGRTFEGQQSAEPVQLTNDEIKRLQKSIAQTTRHLALGELPDAERSMESVNALAGGARDFLKRDAGRARKMFDNCLMTAYLYERANKHQPALSQMLECSRSFPGFKPEGRSLPNEVRRLLEEATLQSSQQPTSLRVASAGRNGCTVRLNGVDVGRTPTEITELRAGVTRVALECENGTLGRIHSIDLKQGDNEIAIDPVLDGAVHSQGGLWLTYTSDRERDRRAATDGQVIAKALGARVVLLFSTAGALGQDILVRPGGSGANKEVARAGYAADSGYARGAASRVASALVAWAQGSEKPAPAAASRKPSPPPQAAPPPTPPPDVASAPAPARRKYTQQHAAAGAILAVIGGAGSAVSWVVYADRQTKREPVGAVSGSRETSYKRAGVVTLTSAALGTTLLSVSEYFWLPNHPDIPAAAWVFGGLGVSLGATAIALSVTTANCEIGETRVTCQHFWADHFFGPLLLLHALPLITVPAWYALRMAFRPAGVQISFSTSVEGLPGLSLHGEF